MYCVIFFELLLFGDLGLIIFFTSKLSTFELNFEKKSYHDREFIG